MSTATSTVYTLSAGGGGDRNALNKKELRQKNAFTLVELLVVIAIIGMLIALLLPAVQAAREAARRMQCSNKLKQLTLTLHNFHDSHDRFPAAAFDEIYVNNELRRGGWMGLILPFMEQNGIYSAMIVKHDPNATLGSDSRSWDMRNKPSGQALIDAFLCPSDSESITKWNPVAIEAGVVKEYACFTNYRGSRGDLAGNDVSANRFYDADPWEGGQGNRNNSFYTTTNHINMPRSWMRSFAHVGDFGIVTSGLSNSIGISEGIIGSSGPAGGANRGGKYKELMAWGQACHYNQIPQNCLNLKGPNGDFRDPNQETHWDVNHFLGRRAWDIWPAATAFYTLLPPNSPNCSSGYEYNWMSAASNHTGGVNASLLDGSVRFVNDSIQVNNLHRKVSNQTPDNPPDYPYDDAGTFSYGVWAELGAINSNESVSL